MWSFLAEDIEVIEKCPEEASGEPLTGSSMSTSVDTGGYTSRIGAEGLLR